MGNRLYAAALIGFLVGAAGFQLPPEEGTRLVNATAQVAEAHDLGFSGVNPDASHSPLDSVASYDADWQCPLTVDGAKVGTAYSSDVNGELAFTFELDGQSFFSDLQVQEGKAEFAQVDHRIGQVALSFVGTIMGSAGPRTIGLHVIYVFLQEDGLWKPWGGDLSRPQFECKRADAGLFNMYELTHNWPLYVFRALRIAYYMEVTGFSLAGIAAFLKKVAKVPW